MTAMPATQDRPRLLSSVIRVYAIAFAIALLSIPPSHAQNLPGVQMNRCEVVTAPFQRRGTDGGGADSGQCCRQERYRVPVHYPLPPNTCCVVGNDGRRSCYRFRTVCRRGPCS